MAFKTIRQGRYESLRAAGFLPFEAQALSKVPQNIPYVQQMIKTRQTDFKKAIKEKTTKKDYIQSVKDAYDAAGYTKTEGYTIKRDPWQLLRKFEDDYKQKHPDWDGDYKAMKKLKRQMKKDFLKKMNNTLKRG